MAGPVRVIGRRDVGRTQRMSEQIREGTDVRWSWGTGEARGTVAEVHHERVERTIKGTEQVRNGTGENPAIVIE